MERSLELAGLTQSEHGIDTIMHLTCTNMEQGTVDTALKVCMYTQNIVCCLLMCSYRRLLKSAALRVSLPSEEVCSMSLLSNTL